MDQSVLYANIENLAELAFPLVLVNWLKPPQGT
jgi:hypothetical protein